MEFSNFDLHPHVAAGIRAIGYLRPTPIQEQAIPPVLKGHDVMGLAQTGTGKTAAFALPILDRLMRGPRGHVRALIVAPTRELAEQIHEVVVSLGKATRLRSVTIYGGVGVSPQVRSLRSGVEIVVACPGRLLDHINQRTIDLTRVEVLVLDEADRMFDMGFLPDVRKIVKHLPSHRQTLLFAATMPADVRKLAQEILRAPVTVQVNYAAPISTVAHALYPVEPHLKTALLLELLRHTDTGSVLIFARTKHRAKRLGEQLGNSGYRAASLQGNLSQNKRQSALDGFRAGSYQILVATDIAARGIDVSSISHVINYDMPDSVDAYTHRIGRTGRAAKTGDAFTFTTREDGEMVRAIERVLGNRVERRTLEGFDYRKPMPGRDIEFARLPRKPQPRGKQKASKPFGHHPALAAPQSNAGGGREKKRDFRSGKARRPRSGSTSRRGAFSRP